MDELTPPLTVEVYQQRLVEAEATAYLYRSLIDQSHDAIYLAYLKTRRVIHVNSRFTEIFGLTLAQMMEQGFDLLSQAAPESQAFLDGRRQARLRGETVSPYYEFTALNRHGQRVQLEVSVSYVEYMGETAVQGILRDVTARKRAEAALRRHATELQAILDISSVLRQAATVDEILSVAIKKVVTVFQATVSSVYLHHDGKLVATAWYPADAYSEKVSQPSNIGIVGYVFTTGEVYISRNIKEEPRLYIPNEVRSPVDYIHAAITLPLQSQNQVLGVLNVGFADGHLFSADEVRMLTAIAEIVGNALARATLLQTLEKRVAQRTQQLEAANQRLQELDRLKSQFVADVSHELKTPITNLKLYLDLFEHGVAENQGRYLSVIRRQTERLERLVQNVLDITRLDISKQDTLFTVVYLNSLVKQVVDAYQVAAKKANLSLSFMPDEHLPPILGSVEQLRQLFNALIVNAINYTSVGQIEVSTFVMNEQQVCVRVKDTGMGIDAEELPYLFDRFYRGQRVSQLNIPGTGLGLSLVKEIVDLHNGEIGLKSLNSEGAIFDIFLPMIK